MIQPLSPAALAELLSALPPPEAFGPGGDWPLLALDLAGTDPGHADWLRARCCPVIGIGEGALADACDVVLPDPRGLAAIVGAVKAAPFAAMILVQHLRASETLSLTDILTAESLAYGTVQAGPDFRAWMSGKAIFAPQPASADPLRVEHGQNHLRLTLATPECRNAIDRRMRDALCEALDVALADPDIRVVELMAEGPCFSTGGAVEEFGTVSDPATAHWIRSVRLPAMRLARLGDRLAAHVNGAAIGAGIEMAAFAHRLTASADAWFQLPELRYGLIPGAGGTASIVRRIGRQRTAYLALSMARLRAPEAWAWGLIDEIV